MQTSYGVRFKRWDWDYFLRERKNVLELWPTGAEIASEDALERAVEYHKTQPWYKFAALRNAKAEEEERIQITAQVGHATVAQTIKHIECSEDVKPDRWYVLTDTYSRKNLFEKAQDAVERSKRDGFSYLNGYPPAIHGVAGARAINESTKAAVGTDNNDEDARFNWEILLAGGFTWGTIKHVEQLIQHSRDYPIDKMIHNQQYMDRLCSYFYEKGVPILRRASANLPGWDSLGFKVLVSLLEVLLAAEQGLKYIDLSLGIGMNLVQDVAAIQSLKKLAREYLDKAGHTDVKIYSWTYFFLGDWPLVRGQMSAQLAWNAAVSALGGCNGMFIKSPDESTTTPTGEGFREAIELCGQIARLVAGQRLPDGDDVKLEREMIELEVRNSLDTLLKMGDGDLALGACYGIETGVLDTMFSPYRKLRGKVKIVRDKRGALRYLDHGDIPLPQPVIDHHRSRIAERSKKEGTEADISWIIREATWASRPLTEEAAERSY